MKRPARRFTVREKTFGLAVEFFAAPSEHGTSAVCGDSST
jgi:hypothetical protein